MPGDITLACWNVNSITQRLPHLLRYMKDYKPDVVCLQETKCINEKFPYMELQAAGYPHILHHGQKAYNGVAIISRFPLKETCRQLCDSLLDESRYIEAEVETGGRRLQVASVYVPNGQSTDSPKFPYKLQYLERLNVRLQQKLEAEEPYTVMGDFNVAPEPLDVANPARSDGRVCFHPEERRRLRAIFHSGYYDSFRVMNPGQQQFSWWDYRSAAFEMNHGLRIDLALLSPLLMDRLAAARIDMEPRGWEQPSDHTPIVVVLRG